MDNFILKFSSKNKNTRAFSFNKEMSLNIIIINYMQLILLVNFKFYFFYKTTLLIVNCFVINRHDYFSNIIKLKFVFEVFFY